MPMETHPTHKPLQRLVILGTPLALGIILLWHPRFISVQFFYDKLLPIVDRWLTIHLLQLPLFGFLALAVYLLVRDLHSLAALVSRVAMGLFVVFYTAFDSIVGIATGMLIRNVHNLPSEQQATIVQAVKGLVLNPIVGDISVISILGGGLGWIMGVFAAAIALYHAGAPRPPLILLALSFIFASHPRPTGSLGMAFFFLAAVWLELFWQRPGLPEPESLIQGKQSEDLQRV
jgi:hypothetical protein